MLKKLIRQFHNFRCLTFKMKILVITVFLLIRIFRLLIIIIPSKHLSILLGRKMEESPTALDPVSQLRALKTAWALNVISNHTRWDRKCLAQAITGQIILRILHIPSTIYLGVSKDESNNMIAHAWLRSGEHVLTGGFEGDQFKCVSYFSR
jgi:hypothetical protein